VSSAVYCARTEQVTDSRLVAEHRVDAAFDVSGFAARAFYFGTTPVEVGFWVVKLDKDNFVAPFGRSWGDASVVGNPGTARNDGICQSWQNAVDKQQSPHEKYHLVTEKKKPRYKSVPKYLCGPRLMPIRPFYMHTMELDEDMQTWMDHYNKSFCPYLDIGKMIFSTLSLEATCFH